jgi:hypothetical protein
MLAQIEVLLRNVAELQRLAIRLQERGTTREPLAAIARQTRDLMKDAQTLCDLLAEMQQVVDGLA